MTGALSDAQLRLLRRIKQASDRREPFWLLAGDRTAKVLQRRGMIRPHRHDWSSAARAECIDWSLTDKGLGVTLL